jgi:hypothetical protein
MLSRVVRKVATPAAARFGELIIPLLVRIGLMLQELRW